MDKYENMRKNMIETQIVARGIKDKRVIKAMGDIPRHEFVPKDLKLYSYDDNPLPIENGQTISQPYIVALMSECLELKGNEKVLEIGTGSGYQAAVLSILAKKVYSIEIKETLYNQAKNTLEKLNYKNIELIYGDGSVGYIKKAPYDRIIVTAAAKKVPQELIKQLKDGGILVIPVGAENIQILTKITKKNGKLKEESITPCRFVPLVRKD